MEKGKDTYKNKEWLEEQYVVLGKGYEEIGKQIDSSPATIWKYCKLFGIAPRKRGPTNSLCCTLDKASLESLYCKDELSDSQIANMFSVGRTCIWKLRNKYGIKGRSKAYGEHLRKRNMVDLSKEALEFIRGELLGDGFLASGSNYSALYGHGSQYYRYVSWLSKSLTKYGVIQSGAINESIGGYGSTPGYNYRSLAYQELLKLYNKWYPDNGEKVVPRDLKLTPLMVRQWYLGDGGLNYNARSGNSSITLHTTGFVYEDVDFLRKLLLDVGIKTNYRAGSNTIYVPVKETERFLSLVGPCPGEIEAIYGYKWCPHQRKIDWQNEGR